MNGEWECIGIHRVLFIPIWMDPRVRHAGGKMEAMLISNSMEKVGVFSMFYCKKGGKMQRKIH